MKYILKALLIIAVCIFVNACVLWAAESVPLFRQIIKTMEITTGYHLTFIDYLKTSGYMFLIVVLVGIIKMIIENIN